MYEPIRHDVIVHRVERQWRERYGSVIEGPTETETTQTIRAGGIDRRVILSAGDHGPITLSDDGTTLSLANTSCWAVPGEYDSYTHVRETVTMADGSPLIAQLVFWWPRPWRENPPDPALLDGWDRPGVSPEEAAYWRAVQAHHDGTSETYTATLSGLARACEALTGSADPLAEIGRALAAAGPSLGLTS